MPIYKEGKHIVRICKNLVDGIDFINVSEA
ncbi:hypothetical protein J2Z76_002860 [Sedimentibacter acidaminivorans]|uniref:Uncharacterized protein n=1 Tax=Sedimentibacter acidaminivorans TaxID=913099 RepID=A0ABS4GH25_9FIRM|nr:hypothetical protein [Sedimentibacter acidaminivorans]